MYKISDTKNAYWMIDRSRYHYFFLNFTAPSHS